ncbi:angiopoietin-1 receptor-like isoform X1 [Apostichopus japonicus]|uniref:angiopoietin-1 receptor-like isoform X1 n=1 Tax=Stichopus japonicus TaxID=307972 RepID=UPI003AB5E0BA
MDVNTDQNIIFQGFTMFLQIPSKTIYFFVLTSLLKTVNDLPVVTIYPALKQWQVKEGEEANVICEANGNPIPEVYVQQKVSSSSDWTTFYIETNYKGFNVTLKINKVCHFPNSPTRVQTLLKFLHPGLSLRRILMTENKYCKLYDFCLKEDASRKVIAMKKMETIPELPIEAKARNEYTWASDSWSTGTCVWKMISYAGSNQTLEQILGLRDQKYPFFVLECLMNCKSIEVADRPPLRDLRTTLRTWMTDQSMEINEIGLTRKLSCESLAEDGYTPMEGNIVMAKH